MRIFSFSIQFILFHSSALKSEISESENASDFRFPNFENLEINSEIGNALLDPFEKYELNNSKKIH